jgi:hypothetical protein
MTTPTDIKPYNAFVKGLITEANALTYPAGASKDERNFILNRNGSRRRRMGVDYESSHAFSSNINIGVVNTGALSVNEWRNAGNDGKNNFGVVQIGATLYFHDLDAASLSASPKSFTVDLNTYSTGYSTSFGSEPVSVAAGRGVMFVSSKDTEPFYIEYDPATDTISATQYDILVRDFDGVTSTENSSALTDDLTTTPTTLDKTHEYNLKNQGFDQQIRTNDGPDIDSYTLTEFFRVRSNYPSNSHHPWLGYYQKETTRRWHPSKMDIQFMSGNTAASKGHFILNAFDKDREALTVDQSYIASGSLVSEVDKNRPTTNAFYAGRVWYAGCASEWVNTAGPANNANIYFSQILTNVTKAGNCYQEGDPTAETANELLVNDGGVVRIPEVGTVKRLLATQQYLIVFADNGVWTVSGALDSGFSANDFQVRSRMVASILWYLIRFQATLVSRTSPRIRFRPSSTTSPT